MATASEFWDYANSGMVQSDGFCNKCNADSHWEPAPSGAPVGEVLVCDGCDRVLNTRK